MIHYAPTDPDNPLIPKPDPCIPWVEYDPATGAIVRAGVAQASIVARMGPNVLREHGCPTVHAVDVSKPGNRALKQRPDRPAPPSPPVRNTP